MKKRIAMFVLAAVVVVFLGLQLDRPAMNNSNDQSKHLSTLYPLPDSVASILTVACYDCHSNNTRHPWYYQIQPVGRWLSGHIQDGKKDLNFSEFASYRPRRQYRKLEQAAELIKENKMPISSYTIMHKEAVLTETQKNLLYTWTAATRDSMKAIFPPDSLKGRKR